MSSRKPKKKEKAKKAKGGFRRVSRRGGILLVILLAIHASVANWFVHHPRAWLQEKRASWPRVVADSLLSVGNRVGDFTDALGWTGEDVVYDYDREAPAGQVAFAGLPRRVGDPAPDDIVVLNHDHFKIGWSPKLHHPVWCAYHVVQKASHPTSRRKFSRDRAVPSAPLPDEYKGSNYDRGHMAPNYAIVTRYGEAEQAKTFLMSNIAPQTPSLNRGAWRDVEHRIAEFWTARYGEIWVIVGCIPSVSHKTFGSLGVDVPEAFYQLVVAQEGTDVRALAVLLPQSINYDAYAARYLISIDELEAKTGLDFLCELDPFIQDPLEAQLPTRLWPIRLGDIFKFMTFGPEY